MNVKIRGFAPTATPDGIGKILGKYLVTISSIHFVNGVVEMEIVGQNDGQLIRALATFANDLANSLGHQASLEVEIDGLLTAKVAGKIDDRFIGEDERKTENQKKPLNALP